jgi:isopentenyl diphosphate isomerase/L-lactate dehydrogenase-like FMN-dependent dehydrogenase
LDQSRLQCEGYSIAALRELARRRLPRMVFDFCDGGADDEITRERNETAFADWEFVPTPLNGTSSREQSIQLFGERLALPVIIGPTGLSGMLWPRGELAIRALPGVVETVAGRIPVLLDGGARRGSHVVKAVALGAAACLIDRPHLWGLAVAGEAGVAQVLEIFRRDIDRVLALGGWDGIAEVERSALTPTLMPPGPDPREYRAARAVGATSGGRRIMSWRRVVPTLQIGAASGRPS